MNIQKELIQVIDTIRDLLTEYDDEQIARMIPAVKDALVQSFSSSEIEAMTEKYISESIKNGYPITAFVNEMGNVKESVKNSLLELKDEYAESNEKIIMIDAIEDIINDYIDYVQYQRIVSEKVVVQFETVHPNAKTPTYAHIGDQGADVYAVEDIVIEPHTYGNMVSTGLKLNIPDGWAIAIRPRSGMSKNTTLRISNAPATIIYLEYR